MVGGVGGSREHSTGLISIDGTEVYGGVSVCGGVSQRSGMVRPGPGRRSRLPQMPWSGRLLLRALAAAVMVAAVSGSAALPALLATRAAAPSPAATPVPLPSSLPGDVSKLLAVANATAGTAWNRLAFWVDSYG